MILFVTATFPLHSQSSTAQVHSAPSVISVLSLQDAISKASAANPQVVVARAQQKQSLAGEQAARAGLLPKLGVAETFTDSTDPVFSFGTKLRQGRFTANDLSLGRLNSPGATTDFTSTAGGSWVLFDSGRSVNQLGSARTAKSAAKAQTEATRQQIAMRVTRAYDRALLADQEKLAVTAAVARASSFAKQAHDRVDAGLALPSDGMQADVELAQQQQAAAEAESNVQIAYAELAALLGNSTQRYELIAPTGTPETIPDSVETLEAQALRARPDLLAAREEIAAADKSVHASHEAYGPTIRTFGNVEADNPHLTGGGNTNWTVGAKAELEIFDGGERRAQASKATAQREIAAATYRQAELRAEVEVQQAFYARQTMERQYGISDEMLKKTQETLRTSLDRYNTGLVTVAEVLREQEQVRDMELHRVQSLYQWWIADAQLRLASGEMPPDQTGKSGEKP